MKTQERCTIGLYLERGTAIDPRIGKRNLEVTTAFQAINLTLLWQFQCLSSFDPCPIMNLVVIMRQKINKGGFIKTKPTLEKSKAYR